MLDTTPGLLLQQPQYATVSATYGHFEPLTSAADVPPAASGGYMADRLLSDDNLNDSASKKINNVIANWYARLFPPPPPLPLMCSLCVRF